MRGVVADPAIGQIGSEGPDGVVDLQIRPHLQRGRRRSRAVDLCRDEPRVIRRPDGRRGSGRQDTRWWCRLRRMQIGSAPGDEESPPE